MIDWSKCPDVESVPDRCGGAWVVKGTRVMVECILDNAEDCTLEQIAREIYDLDLDTVRRMLAFARPKPAGAPETIWIRPTCEQCSYRHSGDWYDYDLWNGCDECGAKSIQYIRADLFDAQVKRMEENSIAYVDETGLRIAELTELLSRARSRLDAFGDAELIDEINTALGGGLYRARHRWVAAAPKGALLRTNAATPFDLYIVLYCAASAQV